MTILKENAEYLLGINDLAKRIKKLYPEAVLCSASGEENVILQDDSDGLGPYIKFWTISSAIPTKESIESVTL